MDSGLDSPALARPQILSLSQKQKSMLAEDVMIKNQDQTMNAKLSIISEGNQITVRALTNDGSVIQFNPDASNNTSGGGHVGFINDQEMQVGNFISGGDLDLITNGVGIAKANGNEIYHSGNLTKVYDIDLSIIGRPPSAEVIAGHLTRLTLNLPSGLVASQARCLVAPSGGNCIFDIQLNGASIGSCTFASGSTTGTFAMASTQNITQNNLITLVSPVNSFDIEDAFITIAGTHIL